MSRWRRVLLVFLLGICGAAIGAGGAVADAPGPPEREAESLHSDFDLFVAPDQRIGVEASAQYVMADDVSQRTWVWFGVYEVRQGQDLETTVESLTDAGGAELERFEEQMDGRLWIRTARTPLAGLGTYTLGYRQQNVVVVEPETGSSVVRLYADGATSGLGFGTVTMTVRVPAELTAVVAQTRCLRWQTESWVECAVEESVAEDGTTVYTATEESLLGSDTMQLALMIKPRSADGTVVEFTPFPAEAGLEYSERWPQVITLIAAVLIGFRMFRLVRNARRVRGRPTIIAEYAAPDGLNVMVAAHLLSRPKSAIPAQLLALASTGNLRIVERQMRRRRGWAVQFVTLEGAGALERDLLDALFGSAPPPNRIVELRAGDRALASRVARVSARAMKLTTTLGLRKGTGFGQSLAVVLSILLAFFFVVVCATSVLFTSFTPWLLAAFFAVPLAIGVSFATLRFVGPLTHEGALLRDHLIGVRDYLRLAEEDRMRILHSVDGSERASGLDSARIIRINQELLPYAVIWGIERSWLTALVGNAVDLDAPPEWLSNPGALAVVGSGRRIRDVLLPNR